MEDSPTIGTGLTAAMALIAVATAAALTVGCLSFHTGPFDDEPQADNFVEVDDTRIRYLDVGDADAEPVVLLHGFNATMNTWDPVIPTLAENHRVLALDLRGFGFSDRPEDADYSPTGQAELVFAFLDNRGVDDAAVVAHSWGTSVALRMALEQPERVRRLALYSAWVYEEQLPTFFYWARADGVGETLFQLFYRERTDDKMAQAFYDPSIMDQQLVDEVDASLQREGALAGALEALRGQHFEDAEQQYSSVDQPTLLLWGREDSVSTLSAGERLSTELPNAQLVVYPRCGHFPMIEAHHASNRRLADFLARDLDTGEAP